MARMTLSTRNKQAVIANLRQYGERARSRAKAVVQNSGQRSFETSQALCPVDSSFMKEHERLEFTPAGFGYQVGFREQDFTSAGKEFYPVFVIFGTSRMPGRDFLFAPNETEKVRFRRELAEALRARG